MCNVVGCQSKVLSRGLCNAHYKQAWKAGKFAKNRLAEIAQNYMVDENGCHIWTGYVARDGYGRSSYKNKEILAHRASYLHHVGAIPDGFFVCHKCDVRSCINPDHLFVGTHQDNMSDMRQKGRAATSNRKLTDENIEYIRKADGGAVFLAGTFGVDRKTIWNIRSGKTWRNGLLARRNA